MCGIKQKDLPNGKFYKCNECNSLVCNNCKGKHEKSYPSHNIISSHYISNYGISDTNKCFICGINQKDLPNCKFYQCRECNNSLCNNCKGKHNDTYQDHNVVTLYISGEINNVKNKTNTIKKSKPNKNHYDYYQAYINPSNNRYDDENLETYSNDNTNISNNNQNYNNQYPSSQNLDNKDQYYINRNKNSADNIRNLNNNYDVNINYNQNDDNTPNYITSKSYNLNDNNDNDNNNNKKIAIKRYNNNRYNIKDKNYDDNNYDNNNNIEVSGELDNKNNNKTLRSKNPNVLLKEKCKIEFDLEKDDKEFGKSEIFGNPTCFNCLKSRKNEKTIQIFYCSQCMKLFCRDCLNQHNKCS